MSRPPTSLIALSLLALAGGARGVTFRVTSFADEVDAAPGDGACVTLSGDCSLRAAIQEANALPGPDDVTLPAGTYTLTLAGGAEDAAVTGDLDITDSIAIAGAGPATTTVTGGAGFDDRIVDIRAPPAAQVTISGLTVSGGRPPAEIGRASCRERV